MVQVAERENTASERSELERVAELLGGARILHRSLRDALEAHELIRQGLPGRALCYLIDNLVVLGAEPSLNKAIGMSLRTFQRRKDNPAQRLSAEQSGRAWKFAEVLARATAVMGSREAAERWLETPATGLNRHRPIDLLETPAGVELVEDFLGRIEYGVYV